MDHGDRVIVLASRNPHKLNELEEICAGTPFRVRPVSDWPGMPEVIEDGTTVRGNASRKALVTAAYTGEIAVADDTSLRVAALGGLPDIFAARFAGPECSYDDNSRLLLDLMRDVPDGWRQACFVSAVAWADPRPADIVRGPFVEGDASARRLHNPFARDIHIKDPAAEDAFWSELIDRRAVWAEYVGRGRDTNPVPGVDIDRVIAAGDRLSASLSHGGRPHDAPSGAIRLPDPRIWAVADGPTAAPPTRVAPSGLPADAPGRGVWAPIWAEISAEGRLWGEIAHEAVGRRGFGYDPVFRPDGSDRSLAEMESEEKNALSHRGRALGKLFAAVRECYALAE